MNAPLKWAVALVAAALAGAFVSTWVSNAVNDASRGWVGTTVTNLHGVDGGGVLAGTQVEVEPSGRVTVLLDVPAGEISKGVQRR